MQRSPTRKASEFTEKLGEIAQLTEDERRNGQKTQSTQVSLLRAKRVYGEKGLVELFPWARQSRGWCFQQDFTLKMHNLPPLDFLRSTWAYLHTCVLVLPGGLGCKNSANGTVSVENELEAQASVIRRQSRACGWKGGREARPAALKVQLIARQQQPQTVQPYGLKAYVLVDRLSGFQQPGGRDEGAAATAGSFGHEEVGCEEPPRAVRDAVGREWNREETPREEEEEHAERNLDETRKQEIQPRGSG
ncbi:hypothetical protein WN55_02088 [Dufourea novaeangliae]|uniref:Uncharacterized protein n=1 Tax=Dufourea novaeangliae TaxID=178035 RepID=A0A154NX07_DUFNO|nr:hypothetical protein WN55_02088 [Dufourea novaeangliae]